MNSSLDDIKVVVRGAGELASGVILRLTVSGYKVIALEMENPECVRRAVCFAEAVYDGEKTIERVNAKLAGSENDLIVIIDDGNVPVLIDPDGKYLKTKPDILIDARMLKRDIDMSMDMAEFVIGLGPGFTVGKNCHAAVETNRGNDLGRVLYNGSPETNTGIPGALAGKTTERVLRAPIAGIFSSPKQIGDQVKAGEEVGLISDRSVRCRIAGILRGLLRDGSSVRENQKIGDIDPRGIREDSFKISDKANAVAGGALEAVLVLGRKLF
ncbi:MAG: selenium-dependent molybdenum cofactor biosynthesis protein YqeB [candidate division Zixibacteria bacterium]